MVLNSLYVTADVLGAPLDGALAGRMQEGIFDFRIMSRTSRYSKRDSLPEPVEKDIQMS